MAQQMAARAQLEEMRQRGSAPGHRRSRSNGRAHTSELDPPRAGPGHAARGATAVQRPSFYSGRGPAAPGLEGAGMTVTFRRGRRNGTAGSRRPTPAAPARAAPVPRGAGQPPTRAPGTAAPPGGADVPPARLPPAGPATAAATRRRGYAPPATAPALATRPADYAPTGYPTPGVRPYATYGLRLGGWLIDFVLLAVVGPHHRDLPLRGRITSPADHHRRHTVHLHHIAVGHRHQRCHRASCTGASSAGRPRSDASA